MELNKLIWTKCPEMSYGFCCHVTQACDVLLQPWFHHHLHPANILLDSNLLPQLSGIATPAQHALTGSPSAAALATIETDVYALGMTMLQLLTGR